jgi:ABC-2 type transport system ATP-binding protein
MGQLYGVPRRDRGQRADELLRQFHLWEKREVPFARLSRGMKRALTVAAALVHRPRLLFPEEPTTKDLLRDLAQLRESASAQAPDADGG